MPAKLIAEEGDVKGLILAFEEGEQWIIGRDPDQCQLLIEDLSVSRKHILCTKTSDGMIIENLSNTNPVFVNDEEIKGPHYLHHGDGVKIGHGFYRFYSNTETKFYSEYGHELVPESQHALLQEQDLVASEQKQSEIKQQENSNMINPTKEDEEIPRYDSIYEEEKSDAKPDLAEIHFDLAEMGRWLLKVVSGPNNGAEFTMQTASSYLVGTDPNSCDIIFHDTSVSRQHARITINEEDLMMIEDLNSRNGTMVDGVVIKGKQPLPPNALIMMGTTSFVVYDREGEMQTIISPLLPSIVKVLQKEETKPAEVVQPEKKEEVQSKVAEPPKHKVENVLSAFIIIAIVTGLFVIIGFGTTTLFKSEPVIEKVIDVDQILKTAISPFPNIKWSFNKATGRLLIVGHVLTNTDRNQLYYNLQGIPFIKSIDDSGVVIDEGVWREINQVLVKNPNWKTISIHSPTPGHFVLSGNLQTRKQADQLWEYISTNFPYLDLLEKRVVVEEDVLNNVTATLHNHGMKEITPQLANAELTLTGSVPPGKISELSTLVGEFREIPGIRTVKSFVTEQTAELTMINISDKYEVSGFSHQAGIHTSIVINGRILSRGDSLDGMTITSIQPHAIFLEKDGVKYRIDYNK